MALSDLNPEKLLVVTSKPEKGQWACTYISFTTHGEYKLMHLLLTAARILDYQDEGCDIVVDQGLAGYEPWNEW